MNDRRCSIRPGTIFAIRVLHSNTLAWLDSLKLDGIELLRIEFTEAHGGPEARAPADGGRRRALSGGITAEVDISEITSTTLVVETVRESRVVIERCQIVLVLIARLHSDNGNALIRRSRYKNSGE